MKALSILKPLAAAALLATAGLSHAALTQYTTSAAWLANVGANGTQAFTGLPIASVASPLPSPYNTAGSFSFSATIFDTTPNNNPSFFYPGGTTSNPYLSPNAATEGILFNGFSAGVAAIAGEWFASNISGLYTAGEVSITVTDSLGASLTTTVNPSSATAGSFLGFVSNGFITSLSLAAVQPTTGFIWPSVDNFRLAAAVPEASTYAMMLAGLGAVGFLARRRRQG